MKFICSHKSQCDGKKTCPHALSHDDCGHTCQRVEGARCVVDVMSLPEIPSKPGATWAIMIWRGKKAA